MGPADGKHDTSRALFMPIFSMSDTNFDVVKKYCDDVISGRILAGRYCKQAVIRFLSDLDKSQNPDFPYFLDVEAADEVIDFAETLVIPDIIPTEENPKRQLRLLPWMKFVYMNVWGWKHKADRDKRRFEDCYIEVARKNSKTTSILFPWTLYDFLTTNAAESYFVSKDLKQSETAYKELVAIIKEDKDLDNNTEKNAQAITFKSSRIAFFCDGSSGTDAYKNSCSIIDEYHDYDTDKIITSFRYGGRARKNRLIVKITSAGLDISKPCFAENQAAKNLLDGLSQNDEEFAIIFAYDTGDDWKNPDLLKKANPSMDELPNFKKETLLKDLVDALEKPAHQPDYISKTCGIWTQSTSDWIPIQKFSEYQPRNLSEDDLINQPCALSFDLSAVNDMTVLTRCFPLDDRFIMKHNFYVPEDTLTARYEKEHIHFRNWVDTGIITATPGGVIDQNYIYEDIARAIELYKPFALYYDPWHSSELLKRLEEDFPKLLQVPFAQGLKNMSPATKDYEEQIYKQKIIDPNPVIKWMLGNVVVKPDNNGNYKPLKVSPASTKRIDGIITSIMALKACREQVPQVHQYKDFSALLNSF